MFPQEIIDLFWSKVDKTSSPNGCWLWLGSISRKGYGIFYYRDLTHKRYVIKAHRFGHLLLKGSIPEGLWVLHKPPCITKHCVLHTYVGTAWDNAQDSLLLGLHPCGDRHGTHTKPERVARGERASLAKLSPEAVNIIRTMRGIISHKDLAQKFGVNPRTISSVQLGRTWQHLDTPTETPSVPIHGRPKLTEQQVYDIRTRYTGKYGEQTQLAQHYGVSVQAIANIIHRKKWKHT